MENIEWIHKIHNTNKNTDKISNKEDYLYGTVQ